MDFGSRALGTFKDSSGIDIALEGDALTLDDMARMLERLKYSTLPFRWICSLNTGSNLLNYWLILNSMGCRLSECALNFPPFKEN